VKPVIFTHHALGQMIERGADREEVLRAIAEGNREVCDGNPSAEQD
jgi:hypothetical protein